MQYVAYYRVSTQMQGKSGLGLEAQRHAVEQFAGSHPIIAEYTEIESGKRNDRPELEAALDHAKANNAVLIIAKLDRLSRDVHCKRQAGAVQAA
ncbi:recombinase family protein [Rhizobium leguminosarum]|uniref:recombinase family protein n=1 Tax=Rhizobium leguminosarum TaxID=384 RepID=UPI001C955BD4|nr:recombinase family protein [Rhizobium leguminosarum]MBY5371815.1 recombinase family protein [Rhizobium leguminosarum]